jgi:hypothetical protein
MALTLKPFMVVEVESKLFVSNNFYGSMKGNVRRIDSGIEKGYYNAGENLVKLLIAELKMELPKLIAFEKENDNSQAAILARKFDAAAEQISPITEMERFKRKLHAGLAIAEAKSKKGSRKKAVKSLIAESSKKPIRVLNEAVTKEAARHIIIDAHTTSKYMFDKHFPRDKRISFGSRDVRTVKLHPFTTSDFDFDINTKSNGRHVSAIQFYIENARITLNKDAMIIDNINDIDNDQIQTIENISVPDSITKSRIVGIGYSFDHAFYDGIVVVAVANGEWKYYSLKEKMSDINSKKILTHSFDKDPAIAKNKHDGFIRLSENILSQLAKYFKNIATNGQQMIDNSYEAGIQDSNRHGEEGAKGIPQVNAGSGQAAADLASTRAKVAEALKRF